MIVADASVIAPALADDGTDGRAARQALRAGRPVHVPHLLDFEVLSVWRRDVRAGRLATERARQARRDMVDLPAMRHPVALIVERIWELRDNVTSYDASYVALAEALGCTLVTGDGRLASAPGPTCRIEVLSA